MADSDKNRLAQIRARIDRVNEELLELLNRRAKLVEELRPVKEELGQPTFDPVREADQIQRLQLKNRGPMSHAMVEAVFKAVFRAALSMQEGPGAAPLVLDRRGVPRTVDVGGVRIGGGRPVVIAGPCAVEDEESLAQTAGALQKLGVRLLRGGAYKPRSSPYTFQGLGLEALEMLARVARAHGMGVVSEVTDPDTLSVFREHVDLIQVGAHNMFNYDLLKRLGAAQKPVLLKRNQAARFEELLLAAEYLHAGGNDQVVLCERGIRTFETATRNTLDVSLIALVKERTDLPILVDVSHAAGRRDLLPVLARAALAAGADGLMVEVHPRPDAAMSDGSQQLDLDGFARLMEHVAPFLD